MPLLGERGSRMLLKKTALALKVTYGYAAGLHPIYTRKLSAAAVINLFISEQMASSS